MNQPRPRNLRERVMLSPVAMAVKRLRYGRFARMQRATDGMLSPAVYKMIYERAKAAPDLDTIEVGGAGGSGSIAFAWGKIDAGHASRHIVVEKLEGGSRRRYGGFEDNLARFERHLREWGAEEKVELFPHWLTRDNSADLLARVRTGTIAGFMLDADGRLDRDFALFLPIVEPEGFIIVDDYHPTRSWKHALTYRLLNRFRELDLFLIEERRSGTVFGRVHPMADAARIDPDECAQIIESVRVDFGFAPDSEVVRLYFGPA